MDIRHFPFDFPEPPVKHEAGDPRRYSARDKARDGTFVRVRAIRADDGDRIRESFTGLSSASIRARWHRVRSTPTAGEIASETTIDPDVHVGLVATAWLDGNERVLGLASFFVDPWSEPRRAEVALLVLDDWQGRGIGALLFGHLARVARAAGVDVLYAVVRDPDARMLRVLERSGLPLSVEREGPEIRVFVELDGTTAGRGARTLVSA